MTDRKPKSTDTAARIKANDVDLQKQEQSSTDVGNQVERTPTATELASANPEVFGEPTSTEEDSTNEEIVPQDRRPETSFVTSDERNAAENGEPLHEPADKGAKIGQRVMLHTANPIGGQTVNPGFIVGFNAVNGKAAIRLELTDGARAKPVDFGGVPKDAADEERGAFYTLPAEDAAAAEAKEKASAKE